ncbi:diguanylate cyclase DosC [Ruminiclostridium hungatei]|uniref:Diguanylate cyclase DosC n=1 Tax=Ruminiclostridium hungatei TaxID=48256 RepID=A0A1V4SQ02_RUMHU|nr:GGDEF domain-containing protein [Ruminiclostridium hungatei]OPX45924.1 diguanylate cyclase DosC [Ruminiclostridium hungatei]
MKEDEFSQILSCMGILRNMYEYARFIDPLRSRIIKMEALDGQAGRLPGFEKSNCFAFWGNKTTCENCISMRAYVENQSFVKIECAAEKVYMTTAVPLETKSGRIVVEFLKDATGSMTFSDGTGGDNGEIYSIIDRMNDLAVRDALTGVYNRRYINEKLPLELMGAVVSQQLLSVIMIDADHYKRVNDTYGHLAGDTVLITLAETLQECIRRETDWVARYGGEEFFICLPGATLKMTLEIAENMRSRIEHKAIPSGNSEIKITASFGVSCRRYARDSKIEDVIAAADEKLYLAKKNGRNRVEW